MRRAFEYLRGSAGLDEHLSSVKMVTDGQSIFKICKTDGDILDALKQGQMSFFLAIDEIARAIDGRVAEYLYDREEFITALKRVETEVEEQLDPETVRRLRAASP